MIVSAPFVHRFTHITCIFYSRFNDTIWEIQTQHVIDQIRYSDRIGIGFIKYKHRYELLAGVYLLSSFIYQSHFLVVWFLFWPKPKTIKSEQYSASGMDTETEEEECLVSHFCQQYSQRCVPRHFQPIQLTLGNNLASVIQQRRNPPHSGS